jgi:hypothetical protein
VKTIFELLARVWKADAFSPTAFVVRALIIAVLFCVSELMGLREYTTFLSGTSANLNVSWQTAATLGLIHLLLYVAFILLVPVSLITAGLLIVWNRWTGRCDLRKQETCDQYKPEAQPRAQAGFITNDRSTLE